MAYATTVQGGWYALECGRFQPSVAPETCLGQRLLRDLVSGTASALPQQVSAPLIPRMLAKSVGDGGMRTTAKQKNGGDEGKSATSVQAFMSRLLTKSCSTSSRKSVPDVLKTPREPTSARSDS